MPQYLLQLLFSTASCRIYSSQPLSSLRFCGGFYAPFSLSDSVDIDLWIWFLSVERRMWRLCMLFKMPSTQYVEFHRRATKINLSEINHFLNTTLLSSYWQFWGWGVIYTQNISNAVSLARLETEYKNLGLYVIVWNLAEWLHTLQSSKAR